MRRYIALLLITSLAHADPASDMVYAQHRDQIDKKVHEVAAQLRAEGTDFNYGDLHTYWTCWYSYTDPVLAKLRYTCQSLNANDLALIYSEFNVK